MLQNAPEKLVKEMLCEVFETQSITAWTVSQRDTYIGLLLFTDMRGFLPRDALVHSAVLRLHVVRLSVCPSVCPSVCL